MKQSKEKNAYLLDGFRKHQNRIEMGKSMSPAGEYENKEQAGLADQSNAYAGIKKSLAQGYKKSPRPCDKTGDLVKRRLPTLPLAQYHRRDEA